MRNAEHAEYAEARGQTTEIFSAFFHMVRVFRVPSALYSNQEINPMEDSIANRLRNLEDREEIRQLLMNYGRFRK
jgi:hypothetical protein